MIQKQSARFPEIAGAGNRSAVLDCQVQTARAPQVSICDQYCFWAKEIS